MKTMKNIKKLICSATIAMLLFSSALSLATINDYVDFTGHWASSSLRKGLNDGLIDGHIRPDDNITTMQALEILTRTFNAQPIGDLPRYMVSGDQQRNNYLAKAISMGLISPRVEAFYDIPISRQGAFAILAEAFQLVEIDPDLSVLDRFSDSELIAPEHRSTLASLVSQGYISGSNGEFLPDEEVSLASFLTMIYRIIGKFATPASLDRNVLFSAVIQGDSKLSQTRYNKPIWFDCAASNISLDNVTAGSVTLRSHNLETLDFSGGTHIKRLTLAVQTGDITLSPASGSATIECLVIGTGNGTITVSGIDHIEVTGSNRNIVISGNVETLLISGRNNTVQIAKSAQVTELDLLQTSYGNKLIVDGKVSEVEIKGSESTIIGEGSIGLLKFYNPATFNIECNKVVDATDYGLLNATITLEVSEILPIGTPLSATATLEDAQPGIDYYLIWYLGDVAVLNATVSADDPLPSFLHDFEYGRFMQNTAEIKVQLCYTTTTGEEQTISADSTVIIENYDEAYWMEQDASWVLEKVTLGYLGDFTLEWAIENDLSDYEKEVWINAKGYTSTSDYLIWINLAYQRVNIFIKKDNSNWELVRTCIVGTGAPGRGTPPGVWTTSYKQLHGWTTYAYTVKPVVRFRGSSGYAFHSRLYYPNTTNLQDPSIGFPISRGCIRMYDEDIWYIYDNIPDGTTVVVY